MPEYQVWCARDIAVRTALEDSAVEKCVIQIKPVELIKRKRMKDKRVERQTQRVPVLRKARLRS